MSVSFQTLAELAYAIRTRGGSVRTDELGRALSRTPDQVGSLVAQGVTYGLVASDEAEIRLTERGEGLGASMEARVDAARRRSLELFKPFTGYIPERWWR